MHLLSNIAEHFSICDSVTHVRDSKRYRIAPIFVKLFKIPRRTRVSGCTQVVCLKFLSRLSTKLQRLPLISVSKVPTSPKLLWGYQGQSDLDGRRRHQDVTVRTLRMPFFPITYVQYAYVILPYFNRTSTSLYDENKLRVSYLQQNFTKVST